MNTALPKTSIAGRVTFEELVPHCLVQRDEADRQARRSYDLLRAGEAKKQAMTALTAEILIVLCEDAEGLPHVQAAFHIAIQRIRERAL